MSLIPPSIPTAGFLACLDSVARLQEDRTAVPVVETVITDIPRFAAAETHRRRRVAARLAELRATIAREKSGRP